MVHTAVSVRAGHEVVWVREAHEVHAAVSAVSVHEVRAVVLAVLAVQERFSVHAQLVLRIPQILR